MAYSNTNNLMNILKLSLKSIFLLLWVCVCVFEIQFFKVFCNLSHWFPFSLRHKVQHERCAENAVGHKNQEAELSNSILEGEEKKFLKKSYKTSYYTSIIIKNPLWPSLNVDLENTSPLCRGKAFRWETSWPSLWCRCRHRQRDAMPAGRGLLEAPWTPQL